VLHKPQWVFLDEATSALDLGSQDVVMSLFSQEFVSTTVVSIGHRPSLEKFHNRFLQLKVSPEGSRLSRREGQAATEETATVAAPVWRSRQHLPCTNWHARLNTN
jgi:ABC-type uncharacterized transport system fused permease/ATPase subunit